MTDKWELQQRIAKVLYKRDQMIDPHDWDIPWAETDVHDQNYWLSLADWVIAELTEMRLVEL